MRIFLFIILSVISFSLFAQGNVYDDFSKKELTGWISGGVDMKYSHDEDNKENGFAEIFTKTYIKPKSYIGKITRNSPFLFSAGNFINVMLQGLNNDINVRISLLYDIDNNTKYNEDKDIMLQSKWIPMNFNGWKEIKIKLDQENFKIISNFEDDFTVTEEEAVAFQLEFESGPNFKESKFQTGIALISEILNKENLTKENSDDDPQTEEKESYFDAKNFPNPFNPATTITYTLKENTYVKLTVYDRLGREVKTLVDEQQNSGTHTVEFNGTNLPSGIYFYRIKTSEKTEVMKMMLAK